MRRRRKVCLLYPLRCIKSCSNDFEHSATNCYCCKQIVNEKMDADVTDKLLFVYTVVGCKACLEQMYRADGIAEMTSRGVFQMTN